MYVDVFQLAMSQNPKVSKALAVTRALGIPDEKVMPILKNLFKLYGKKWELIEEDNYRTLLDAYFELENKETDDKNPSMEEKDGLERPAKRVCMEDQGKEAGVSDRAQYSSGLLHAHNIDKGKKPIPHHLPLKVAKMSSMETQSPVLKKTSIAEGGSLQVHKQSNKELFKSKTESLSGHSLQSCEPSSSGPQGSQQPSDISPSRNYSMKAVASSNFDINERDDCSTRSDSTREWQIEVASSSLGEIKIFLNCRSNYFQQTLQRPKLDSVMKLVEEKYLLSHKITGHNISIVKLLKDLCECYIEVGKDTPRKSKIAGSSEVVSNASNTCEELNKKAFQIDDYKKDLDSKVHNSNGNTSSNGDMVIQKQPSTHNWKHIIDITKGTENVKISLVDDSGKEKLPTFNYIHHNIVYQNAHVQFSLARISDEDCCSSCLGDCLSSTFPCACARETGGEFAYTTQGLLKKEFLDSCIAIKNNPQEGHFLYCQDCPIERSKNEHKPEKCKGHLVRKFIKECWRKCGCDRQCGNRVVQRGITRKLQVFLAQGGKGWGVRAVEDLPKGAFVCEYVGEIVTNIELYYRNMEINANERHTYPVLLDADWGSEGVLQDDDALCLDATYHGNVARFINHRCFDANLIDIPVEVETPDRHYYHLAFFTTRKVVAFEELTWDYGIDFADLNHPVKAFQCSCGSAYCRDINQNVSNTSWGITLR